MRACCTTRPGSWTSWSTRWLCLPVCMPTLAHLKGLRGCTSPETLALACRRSIGWENTHRLKVERVAEGSSSHRWDSAKRPKGNRWGIRQQICWQVSWIDSLTSLALRKCSINAQLANSWPQKAARNVRLTDSYQGPSSEAGLFQQVSLLTHSRCNSNNEADRAIMPRSELHNNHTPAALCCAEVNFSPLIFFYVPFPDRQASEVHLHPHSTTVFAKTC